MIEKVPTSLPLYTLVVRYSYHDSSLPKGVPPEFPACVEDILAKPYGVCDKCHDHDENPTSASCDHFLISRVITIPNVTSRQLTALDGGARDLQSLLKLQSRHLCEANTATSTLEYMAENIPASLPLYLLLANAIAKLAYNHSVSLPRPLNAMRLSRKLNVTRFQYQMNIYHVHYKKPLSVWASWVATGQLESYSRRYEDPQV